MPDALVLAQRRTRGEVRQMLSQLRVSEQTVLEAMFLDEQSKDEICRRLGAIWNYLRVLFVSGQGNSACKPLECTGAKTLGLGPVVTDKIRVSFRQEAYVQKENFHS